jgi:putative lipoic acid-binding regulatory protein
LEGLPSRDLLESTHTFPCVYPFKVIGDHEEHFVRRVLAVIKVNLAEGVEPAFSSRVSAGGRHVCVTIEPELEHAGQVLEIYRQLRELDGLRMLM